MVVTFTLAMQYNSWQGPMLGVVVIACTLGASYPLWWKRRQRSERA